MDLEANLPNNNAFLQARPRKVLPMTRYGVAVVSDPEPCSEGAVVISGEPVGQDFGESRRLQVAPAPGFSH